MRLFNLLKLTLMTVIEAMEINNSSIFTGFIFGFIASSTLVSIVGSNPSSINDSTPSSVTILTSSNIIGRVTSILIDLKTTFFYNKQAIVKNYISSKLYIK